MVQRIDTKSTPSVNKIVLFVLAIIPLLYTYGFAKWSFSDILLFGLGIVSSIGLLFSKTEHKNFIPLYLLILTLDYAVVYLYTVPGASLPIFTIQLLFCYIAFWYFITPDSINNYIKIYKNIAIVVLAFFYIQFFYKALTGTMINGIFTWLPISEGVSDDASWVSDHVQSDRCSSFFSEPSYLCRYLMPLFVIELFKSRNINWIFLALLALPAFLNVSGTGIIVLLVIIFFWYLSRIKSSKKYFSIAIVTLVLIVFYFILMSSEMGAEIIDRSGELAIEDQYGSRSGNMRLWRGYAVFAEYSWQHKLIGTQDNNTIFQYESMGIFGSLFGDRIYFNGISTLLLRQGLIGLSIFILFIAKIWKNASLTGKAIILSFLVYMLCESMYPGERMATMMVLAFCINKETSKQLTLL